MSLCGNALGGVWMVTAGLGTGQWWMVASAGLVVWMMGGAQGARGGGVADGGAVSE